MKKELKVMLSDVIFFIGLMLSLILMVYFLLGSILLFLILLGVGPNLNIWWLLPVIPTWVIVFTSYIYYWYSSAKERA